MDDKAAMNMIWFAWLFTTIQFDCDILWQNSLFVSENLDSVVSIKEACYQNEKFLLDLIDIIIIISKLLQLSNIVNKIDVVIGINWVQLIIFDTISFPIPEV